jgi:Predicted membrane protein (DUF2254)
VDSAYSRSLICLEWTPIDGRWCGSPIRPVSSLSLSFVVFTFASLLVAIQVAGGQYSPRIIATTFIRYSVGIFVFSLLFAVKAAGRVEATVHQLLAFITVLLGLICIVVF